MKWTVMYLCCLLVAAIAFAQPDTAWVRHCRGTVPWYSDGANALAVDALGRVCVTGWLDRYSRPGWFGTVKYSKEGDTLWFRRGPAGSGCDVAVDGSGCAIVTGTTGPGGGGGDYYTIKYDTAGVELWANRYNGPANLPDGVVAVAVDDAGNVCVAGNSTGLDTTYDYCTIKYGADGEMLWVRRYEDAGGARAIVLDASANVHVTGATALFPDTPSDFCTIKYDPVGVQQWVAIYSGTEASGANGIAVDGQGNVVVTGWTGPAESLHDYCTVKYDPAGVQQWVRYYDGPGHGRDQAPAIAVDAAGNVFVTGWSRGLDTTYDYCTIKYGPDGDTVWTRRYSGPGARDDYARALAVDGNGNVYVTGQSAGLGTGDDYCTVKYGPMGEMLWVHRYDGPLSEDDIPNDIAVDGETNVFLAGLSAGADTAGAFCTMKLVQYSGMVGQRTEGASAEPGLPTILKAPALARLDCRVLGALGRDVTERKDVLSLGIYFVRSAESGQRQATTRKVIIQR